MAGVQPVVEQKGNFADGDEKVAFILGSEPAVGIFRRFNWLSVYCLLEKQKALMNIETSIRNNAGDPGDDIQEATRLLSEYSALVQDRHTLLGYSELLSDRTRKGLLYFLNGDPGVKGGDVSWLQHIDDLVVIDPRPKQTWLERAIDGCLQQFYHVFPLHCIKAIAANDVDRAKFPQDEKLTSYSRMKIAATLVASPVALTMILLPIGLLYFHINDWSRWQNLGLVIGFSLLFVIFLLFATSARFHEIVTGAAGYCALLVVFLGLTTTRP